MDDMVVRFEVEMGHAKNLASVFGVLRRYQLKLNLEKCSFRIKTENFLGFMLTRRGIEENLKRCSSWLGESRWTDECEVPFQELKMVLASPLIQTRFKLDNHSRRRGKVLQGAELRYQKIEKTALVIITTKKLRPYFQSHPVICRTNLPIR
ncbi:hypothetical protein CR513_47777, partial [Mucuna pruriens]